MGPFGAPYPPALQAAVRHAGRLSSLLAREEAARAGARSRTAAWVTGRASEIERFVEDLTLDLRSGRRTAESLGAALDAYLVALHAGMAQRLAMPAPGCCARVGASDTPTRTPSLDTIERLLGDLEARR